MELPRVTNWVTQTTKYAHTAHVISVLGNIVLSIQIYSKNQKQTFHTLICSVESLMRFL